MEIHKVNKKMTSKSAQQPGIEEPALKRKKRRKESRVADPWKEVGFP